MSKNPNYTGGERFNKLSKKDGYRSRAAYKLKQINKLQNLIKQNQNILDIGCAPGSWIQVIKEITKGKANITGVDILPMEKIEGIIFLQKDLLEIKDTDLKDHFHLVLSDIAPNITGIEDVDQAHFFEIFESISSICSDFLNKKGILVMKFFNGSSYDLVKKRLKMLFNEVNTYKPDSSRSRSNEVFFVCIGYKD